jgi:hypothetical protein
MYEEVETSGQGKWTAIGAIGCAIERIEAVRRLHNVRWTIYLGAG